MTKVTVSKTVFGKLFKTIKVRVIAVKGNSITFMMHRAYLQHVQDMLAAA